MPALGHKELLVNAAETGWYLAMNAAMNVAGKAMSEPSEGGTP
jgi:hypothetical protein